VNYVIESLYNQSILHNYFRGNKMAGQIDDPTGDIEEMKKA